MEGSTEFKKKWRELRNNIKVPAKNATNPHFRNKYRSWDDCEKALSDAGIYSHFRTINNTDQAGVEWWVEIDEEEVLVNVCMVDKVKRDPQASGSCYTYALRYCVTTYLGWGEPDDDGNEAMGFEPAQQNSTFDMAKPSAPPKAAPQPTATTVPEKSPLAAISPEQHAQLLIMVINGLQTKEGWSAFYSDNHLELTALQADDQQQWQKVVDAYTARKLIILENLSKKENQDGTAE